MTSVLYSAGLNYQASNPIRLENNRIRADLADLRALLVAQTADLALLKAQVASCTVDKLTRKNERPSDHAPVLAELTG